MIYQALSEAADKGELMLIECGLCRWHLRRDGVIVIREIIVLPCCRGRGRGRAMVLELMHKDKPLLAKCPADYQSNAFWEKIGFTKTEPGKINTWRWLPASYTAQTATPLLPASP